MTDSAPGAITFILSGEQLGSTRGGGGAGQAGPAPQALVPGLGGTVKASVRLGARRGSGDALRVDAVPGRDMVLLQLANGPTLVLDPATARDLLLAQTQQANKGPPPTEVAVPAQLQWERLEQLSNPARGGMGGGMGGATRGATRGALGGVLLSMVQVVTGHLQDTAAGFAAGQVAKRVDGQVDPGVYALQPGALEQLKGSAQPLTDVPEAADGGPLLVLLHGTFSNTFGTFGKLWTQHPQRVQALFNHHGGRVYALDHPTLSASPIDNALMLARALPAGARLHLLTHSRGGLVAEVMARVCAPPTPDDGDALALFDGAAFAGQKQTLQTLIALARTKGLRVDRVVRVACPARGTLLASSRLDAYVSVFKWTLELAGLPVLPELVDFLGAVAQRREDPAVLPGLQAQTPDSPLVRWLHAADQPLPGQLRVVAGDMEADSITSWLKTLLSDSFFWTDNDLVVQTSSMYGGAPRAAGASFLLDVGAKVSHFTYFQNERTADAIISALTQDAPQNFQAIGPLSWAGEAIDGVRGRSTMRSADGTPASDRPAVFVLPGILGSNLAIDGKRIWLGWRLINGLQRLNFVDGKPDGVTPDGPIAQTYGEIIDYLADSHEVIGFAYDWRRPLEHEARRLGLAVEAALAAREHSGQPVRLLAHSMGGLLARTLQLECPQIWDRLMAHRDARLLMLGTPNAGSWAPMQVLSGDDTFGNTLVAFGAPFQDHAARDMMAQFPGFLQLQANLLDEGLNLDDRATWLKLAQDDLQQVQEHNWWHTDERQLAAYQWGVPGDAVLKAAVALHRRLQAQVKNDLPRFAGKLRLVVGRARFTPEGYQTGADGLGYLNARDGGDGRVTLASAMLPGVRSWFLDCEHGKLADEKAAFPALLELLQTGSTALLPPQPELAAGGPARGAAVGAATGGVLAGAAPVSLVLSRPSRMRKSSRPPASAGDVQRLMPDEAPAARAPATGALRITVTNGDLKFVRQPLLLGHYRSLTLTGTELVIDRLIGGTMRESLTIGRYPDLPGSMQVFGNTAANLANPLQLPRPAAAIVVGLGPEGKLTGSDLVYTVRQGVIAWAQQMVEAQAVNAALFELAVTLIGSGGSGVSAGQAAQWIAQGAHEANQRLADDRLVNRPWPRVGHLHLIELYLDRASEAWRALQAQATAMPGCYQVDDAVATGAGALRRPPDSGYRGASYDLISAVAADDGSGGSVISYTLDTKRARSEVRAQKTQGPLVRELVRQGSNDRNQNRQIGRTLFNLLVPVEMESFLGGTTEMLIELNAGSAGIPWELLDTQDRTRTGGDPRPWAIRSKLLRKLRVDDFRQQVVDAGAEASVLVIGEPQTGDPSYPRLAGARNEANAVVTCLSAPTALGRDCVHTLISPDDESAPGPDASAVINALMERDWRIVHIAGHGEPPEKLGPVPTKPDDPQQRDGDPRGVVLSGGIFLGPREIANMRVVPELVFVNCCHLGARNLGQLLTPEVSGRPLVDRTQFAASVAEALIGIGVRCVIAAGWAVEDGPAMTFASTFYNALLNGRRFIDAVAAAREAAWNPASNSNTWAAYQCYGDPDWYFQRKSADAQRPPPLPLAEEFAGVASAPGLALALETLAVRSSFDDASPRDKAARQEDVRAKLRHLDARFSSKWASMGAVAEAFGLAWNAAGDRAAAIGWYQRAVAANDGSASLKASQELGNLQVRAAETALRAALDAKDKPAAATANAALKAARQTLEQLAELQPTMERLSLLGSACKRQALAARALDLSDAVQNQFLADMERYYARAESTGRREGQPNVFYPALNCIGAQLVRGQGRPGAVTLDDARLADIRQQLVTQTRDDPDFWSVVGLTELRLYEALAAGTLADAKDTVLAEYADLRGRVSAPDKWDSVADQLRFVLGDALAEAAPAQKAAGDGILQVVLTYGSAGAKA